MGGRGNILGWEGEVNKAANTWFTSHSYIWVYIALTKAEHQTSATIRSFFGKRAFHKLASDLHAISAPCNVNRSFLHAVVENPKNMPALAENNAATWRLHLWLRISPAWCLCVGSTTCTS
jgi:hypothetical protein